MKNMIKIAIVLLFAMTSAAFISCGKTHEKTTTIIREKNVPAQETSGVKFKIQSKGQGIEVNAGGK